MTSGATGRRRIDHGVTIYTDGGWSNGRAGWAWVAVDLARAELLGDERGVTRPGSSPIPPGSYWAEVYAVLRALESPYAPAAIVRTDMWEIRRNLNEGIRKHLDRSLTAVELRVAELLAEHDARIENILRNSDQWAERADRLANRRRAPRRRRRYHH